MSDSGTIQWVAAAAVIAALGTPAGAAAKALNERGVPTATGKGKWEAMQVGRVLGRLAPASAS
jgi:hypothetical protein